MMKKFMAVVAVVGWLAQAAGAVTVWPATEQERAAYGATWVIEFTYGDLTTTETNTAQTFTNVFPLVAKMGVECRAAVLATAFDSGNTNYTTSLALKVGDSSDDDLFLSSTELASDGTEVYLKYGQAVSAGSAYATNWSLQTKAVTNLTLTTTVVTNWTALTATLNYMDTNTNPATTTIVTGMVATAVTVVNGATAAAVNAVTGGVATALSVLTGSVAGQKLYTSDDYLKFTFTPNEEEATDEFTSGKVRVYMNVWDAR